jgi:YidC/Oxa1 family membrane protein insertase
MNSGQMGPDTNSQMKMMQYMMPVMMLGFFNNFAAALSYYYLLFNVLSIVQQVILKRFFINETAIRAKIDKNKANPNKTGFQARLQAMMKQQQEKGKK